MVALCLVDNLVAAVFFPFALVGSLVGNRQASSVVTYSVSLANDSGLNWQILCRGQWLGIHESAILV